MLGLGKFTKILLGAASAAAIASAAAQAADPVLPEVSAAAGYNWSGFYAGIGGGAGAGVHDLTIPIGPDLIIPLGRDGVFGELTVGYDYMVSPRFVVGAYADARYGNIGFSIGAPGDSLDSDADYGFDVLARAGYLVTPRTLAYVLGGYSWQHFEISATGVGTLYDWDASGYVLGLGMETVLHDKWTLKGEYRYSNYESDDLGSGGFVSTDPSYHTFHIGLNHRLNGGVTDAGFETPAYDWTGFFVGGAVGAGATVNELDLGGFLTVDGFGGEGVFGEINTGYDHEFGNFVAGIMADARYSGISTELSFGTGSLNLDADYGFDVLGRVGAKVNDTALIYLQGGYSWQHFDVDITGAGSVYDWGASGFSVGGGIEAPITPNLTVDLNYRYSQYEDEDFGSGGAFALEPSFHTVRLGAKWKFNAGG